MTSNTPNLELITKPEGSFLREVGKTLCPTCGCTIDDQETAACQLEHGERCILGKLADSLDRERG